MRTPIKYKLINAIRKFIARICGKEYGCCDKWFVNCERCMERKKRWNA